MYKKLYSALLIVFMLIFSIFGCKSAESSAEQGNNVTTDSEFVDSEEESTMHLHTFEDDTQDESTQKPPEDDSKDEPSQESSEDDTKQEETSQRETEATTTGREEMETIPDFNPTKTVFDIDKDMLPYTQMQIYNQLFDLNNKVELNINISDSELAKIQKDYEYYSSMGSKSPIYRVASVDIKITTAKDSYTYHIEEVGIRMKGNTSRTSFYDKNEGIYNLVHFKLDFQETFDDKDYYGSSAKQWGSDSDARDARKDRTFATLEKIDIKWNRNNDATFIREYYAYETYRSNGVLAPHTNITSVDMADEHLGMYTLYEPIDKIFIEKYVAKEDQGGDLYKCGWTHIGAGFFRDSSIGVEDEDNCEFYNYDLKTNKKTSKNTELANLIKYLNGKSVSKEELAKFVDIDNFLKFEAVSYFVGNPDDLRNNYNNHYIYFLKSSGKVVFIPYDMDRCLGVTNGWNPDGTGMTKVNPFSKYAAGANENQANPLYRYTVDEGGFYVKEFAEVLKTVSKSEYFTESKFNSLFKIAKNNYSDDTTPSKDFHNTNGHSFKFSNISGNGNMSFKEYIDAKMNTFNKYISKADEYSSENVVQPYYIRGSFNGWNAEEYYRMTYNSSDNTYSYELKISDRSELKVNNGVEGDAGDWYGYDDVISSIVSIDEGDRGNIVLPRGTYTIIFSAKDKTITIK